jgi:hypothetical protein
VGTSISDTIDGISDIIDGGGGAANAAAVIGQHQVKVALV